MSRSILPSRYDISTLAQRKHMDRLPPCPDNSVEAMTWHKKAKKYWELFGSKFNDGDQELYCDLVTKIQFRASTHIISHHPITIGAIRDPSWPALILIQLGFKPFEKFATFIVGSVFSRVFATADLSFPFPNGGMYPSMDQISPSAQSQTLKLWKEILDTTTNSRVVFSESPVRVSPVPLPLNIQQNATNTPDTDVVTFSTPHRTFSSSPCPANWLSRSKSTPASSIAVVLPGLRSSKRSQRAARAESSLFVSPGLTPSPTSNEPIVIDDDFPAVDSPADSDDLPLTLRLGGRKRDVKTQRQASERKTSKHDGWPHRTGLNELSQSEANRRATMSKSREKRARSNAEEEYLTDSEQPRSEKRTTRTPRNTAVDQHKEPRGTKRARSKDDDVRQNPSKDRSRRLKKQVDIMKNRMTVLEEAFSARKAELKEEKQKQKRELKKQKLDIDDMRREIDRMSMEMKIREETQT